MANTHKHTAKPHLKGEMARFWEEREQLNEMVLQEANLVIRRFFNLDHQTYQEGALPVKIKELLGLVASLVLRCDDCIAYHLVRCYEEEVSTPEFMDALSVGLVVGGSITIPHIRRAVKRWQELQHSPDE